MNQSIAIGVDIGGSHISSAAVDLLSGRVLKATSAERKVDNQAPAAEIISVWASCLKDSLAKVPANDVKGIGFAMPGPFDYVEGVSYIKGVSKYENLYGVNVAEAIRTELRASAALGVRFMNDASSFAVGEAWVGKAASHKRSMSITLGTGLGSAFVDDRIPVVDGPNVPKLGCVYHLPYKDSIADDYFSTRWFIKRYEEETGTKVTGVKALTTVRDAAANTLFDAFGGELAGILSPWLKKFGAEVLVIGGNISFAWDFFGRAFEERLAKESCSCRVHLSELKEDAALLGAAYLFDDSFWKAVQHALPLMTQAKE